MWVALLLNKLWANTISQEQQSSFHFKPNHQLFKRETQPWALKQLSDLASALQINLSCCQVEVNAKYRQTYSVFSHIVWQPVWGVFFVFWNSDSEIIFISTVTIHHIRVAKCMNVHRHQLTTCTTLDFFSMTWLLKSHYFPSATFTKNMIRFYFICRQATSQSTMTCKKHVP